MKNDYLQPAALIIERIGAQKVADVTGKHVSRIYRWRAPKERGGTNGVVPHADAQKLLAQFPELFVPADFFSADQPEVRTNERT